MREHNPAEPSRRMRIHVGIHVVLILLYFFPGGLLWNRVEPLVFGLPLGVVVTAVVLPVLIIVNMVLYVQGHWAEDRLVTSQVRQSMVDRPIEQTAAQPSVFGAALRGYNMPHDQEE